MCGTDPFHDPFHWRAVFGQFMTDNESGLVFRNQKPVTKFHIRTCLASHNHMNIMLVKAQYFWIYNW